MALLARYRVIRIQEFEEWFADLSLMNRGQIDDRFFRIEEYGHFGDFKLLGEGLAELRWKNGLRIYFSEFAASTTY